MAEEWLMSGGIKVETLEEAQQAINMLTEFVFANSIMISEICEATSDPYLWHKCEEWNSNNWEIKERYPNLFKE